MTVPQCILISSRTVLLKPMCIQIIWDLIKTQILFQQIWGGAWVSLTSSLVLVNWAHFVQQGSKILNSPAPRVLICFKHSIYVTLLWSFLNPLAFPLDFELPPGITVPLAPKHNAVSTNDQRLNFITQCSTYPLYKVTYTYSSKANF